MGGKGDICNNLNNKDLIIFFKHAVNSPALSEKEELTRSSVAEGCPELCVTIDCHRLARGVGASQHHSWGPRRHCPVDRSVVCALALRLPKGESSPWPPEPVPGLFYICLPRVLQLLINFFKLPWKSAATFFVPTIATLG